jgi:hypothetical protein
MLSGTHLSSRDFALLILARIIRPLTDETGNSERSGKKWERGDLIPCYSVRLGSRTEYLPVFRVLPGSNRGRICFLPQNYKEDSHAVLRSHRSRHSNTTSRHIRQMPSGMQELNPRLSLVAFHGKKKRHGPGVLQLSPASDPCSCSPHAIVPSSLTSGFLRL